MAILNPGGSPAPDSTAKPTQPMMTPREAKLLGFDNAEFQEARQYWRMTIDFHAERGTPRGQWTPPALVGAAMTNDAVLAASDDMAACLAGEVDPQLDEAQDDFEAAGEIVATLHENLERGEPIATPDSGTSYTVYEAVEQTQVLDTKIENDESQGRTHHRRAPGWLKAIAPWLPIVEFVGFSAFVMVWLNVPLFEPWLDWGGWILSVAIVAAVILGQTWLIHHAGTSHNEGREDMAENNREEGERLLKRRTQFLVAAGLTVTAAITIGMLLRGIMTLGSASVATIVFMAFIAVVAGYIMPALSYLAIALDGSKRSRERDHLASVLDRRLGVHNADVAEGQQALARVFDTQRRVLMSSLPYIVTSTQAVLDESYRMSTLTWTMIGHLDGQAPQKVQPDIELGGDSGGRGTIRTSIFGADTVDLQPLFDRGARLSELVREGRALAGHLEQLEHHPWSRS